MSVIAQLKLNAYSTPAKDKPIYRAACNQIDIKKIHNNVVITYIRYMSLNMQARKSRIYVGVFSAMYAGMYAHSVQNHEENLTTQIRRKE